MGQLAVIWGTLRYEYRMQIRRVSVWVVLGLLCLIIFGLWSLGGPSELHGYIAPAEEGHAIQHFVPPDPRSAVLDWVQFLGMFVPLGIGLVLADRLARDKRIRVDELLDTSQGSLGARLTGKFLGSTLATLTPLSLIFFGLVAYMVQQTQQFGLAALALQGFALILLPAALFVAGFSVTLPVILRVPVYQFLFTGYWFWANLMSPKIGIPSIVGTMLNAAGPWAQEGILNYHWAFLFLHATPLQGYLSIALLIGCGLAAVLGMGLFLRWQYAQR